MGSVLGLAVNPILFQPPTKCTSIPTPKKIIWLKNAQGNPIPAVFFRPGRLQGKGSKKRRAKVEMINPVEEKFERSNLTIIYSHANSEDLGLLYEKFTYLSNHLGANILAYDYTGYGYAKKVSEAQPSEEACYADIEAVYGYLMTLGIPPIRVVLYGRSVGTGPTCYLAEKLCRKNIEIGGVILHSPFISVYRVVADCGFSLSCLGDMFPNIEKAENIDLCPVYVIHGTDDEIIPFYHGCMLYDAFGGRCTGASAVKEAPVDNLWVEGMRHNSMSKRMSINILHNLQQFLSSVNKRAADVLNEQKV